MNRRVALLGYGSIGRRLAELVTATDGLELVGVVTRSPGEHTEPPRLGLDQAIAGADVIVECAGQQAVRDHAEAVIAAGTDLVVASSGALLDGALRSQLAAGPGRLAVTAGAIGGLDLLVAASRLAPFRSVSIRTSKLPVALVQDWMDPSERDALLTTTTAQLLFRGSVTEAARRFPASVNVAATLGLALDHVATLTVEVEADPGLGRTVHRIRASGPVGDYDFAIGNAPSPDNPRTSEVVPAALLRTLLLLSGDRVGLVI